MELADIYNARREKTGKVVDRKTYLLQEGEYLLCVGCWVFNSRHEIFLTRRALSKDFMPGKWENPAGHVIAGETGREAMARELFEETGIKAAPEDFFLFAESANNDYSFGEEYVLFRDFKTDAVTLQDGETCDCKWVCEEEFERMVREGEVASSVAEHLAPHKEAWLKLLHRE